MGECDWRGGDRDEGVDLGDDLPRERLAVGETGGVLRCCAGRDGEGGSDAALSAASLIVPIM